jgi:hypothetical protein
MLPGEWPGRCSTSKVRSPRSIGHGGHQGFGQLVAARPDGVDHPVAYVGRRQRGEILRVRELFLLAAVGDALLELVEAADVVVVAVSRDSGKPLFEQMARGLLQAGDAEAGVHHHVPVAPAHMPDVAADEGVDVGFPDEGDVVVDPREVEPSLADPESHDASTVRPGTSRPASANRLRANQSRKRRTSWRDPSSRRRSSRRPASKGK